jgi:hypothetical protein
MAAAGYIEGHLWADLVRCRRPGFGHKETVPPMVRMAVAQFKRDARTTNKVAFGAQKIISVVSLCETRQHLVRWRADICCVSEDDFAADG